MTKKEKQIKSAKIDGDVVILDISTPKHLNTTTTLDLDEFLRWKSDHDYGRIHAVQSNNASVYAQMARRILNTSMFLHQYITSSVFDVVDHKDRDSLNNRKSNLRDGGGGVNQTNINLRSVNSSGFCGVYFNKAAGKYRAYIKYNKKNIHLGYFTSAVEASKAYESAKMEYHKY